MSAEALPASGDTPPAKTCDAGGMAEIHRLWRRGFGEAPDLVRGVGTADLPHADAVGEHLATLSSTLHSHHEAEDENLWSKLEERAPACAVHVERMKAQHAEMLVHLTALDAALPAWRRSALESDAAPVLSALDGVNDALAAHLPDEEATIVPVMETVITQKEVEWFAEHGRKSTPKGQTWNVVGAIVNSQPDPDEYLKRDFPAAFRLLWRWIGRPKYEKNRAVLEGR
ncbi:hypothetical protein GCM10022200_16030 [Microbacterium awajiense]|uniref:Hemerythrin-like domain-containing protein n=1 Tax=Microbacterium awajiense TaxID=415214 RepID=A0ABP7AJ53_9MICO